MQSINDINAINMLGAETIFIRVIELGSFKKTAEDLGIEPSTVSRKIAKLESRLGTKLFHRSTVKTLPTDDGQAYYNGLKQIISSQEALEFELFGNRKEVMGHLRIASTVDLGDHLLAPIISEMLASNPHLTIELILGSNLDDLVSKNVDVAIRIGKPTDSNLYARSLGTIPRVLVASPAYLSKHGTPKKIQDLKQHRFICYSKEQAKASIQFENGEQFGFSESQSPVIANSLRSIKYFVKKGFGINWGPKWAYQDDLTEGLVSIVLPDNPVKGFEMNAIYTMGKYLPHRVRWFLDELESKNINFNQLKWALS